MSATMIKEFRLPDLGEGLTESEIVAWKVAVGDTVTLNQIIAEVETAKAVVELPSPFAGVVAALHEQPGTVVEVGKPIVSFEIEGDDGGPAAFPVPPGAGAARRQARAEPRRLRRRPGSLRPARPPRPHLRGPGSSGSRAAEPGGTQQSRLRRWLRRSRRGCPNQSKPSRPQRCRGSVRGPRRRCASWPRISASTSRPSPARGSTGSSPVTMCGTSSAAGTSPRQCRDLGSRNSPARRRRPPGSAPGERETRTPIKGVRKFTAAAMVASAFTAPHVTEFLTVDVTPTMELLARLKASRAFAGYKLTPLTLVSKAVLIALRNHPTLNARWDEANQEIVQFNYVNLGIAAATPRGLTVPNIKDADRMSLLELSTALTELTDTARAGKTSPEALSGGTISITNIGVFGIDAGTPILNPGEAAILALGAVRKMPWEYQDEVALRQVMTLSLSFDHRLVDGEQGSRFLQDLGTMLADPGMVLAMV